MKPDIIAKEGMWLTNGETFSKSVYLGNNDSADNWHEITEEEYENVIKEQGGTENEDQLESES